MPTITASLAEEAARSTAATQQAALDYELKDQQQRTSEAAEKAAAKAKEKAEKKAEAEAEAEAKRKAEAAREAAAAKAQEERASRSSERTTLAATASEATSSAGSSATGSAASLLSFLKAQVGKAYVSGATGPSAYDCSGLTQAAFRTVGVDLPRVSGAQSTAGTQVSLSALQPGDILYWGSAGSAYHVGVYIGDGKFIGAQNSSTGVVERSLDYDPPAGAVRVL